MQEAFKAGYMAAPDAWNPHILGSVEWDAFSLGQFFRSTGRVYDVLCKSEDGTYRSRVKGEVFRVDYQPSVEVVREVERSGRGRGR